MLTKTNLVAQLIRNNEYTNEIIDDFDNLTMHYDSYYIEPADLTVIDVWFFTKDGNVYAETCTWCHGEVSDEDIQCILKDTLFNPIAML